MIEFINCLEISISQRFDHIAALLIDMQQLTMLVRDQEKKKNQVRNFRNIKQAEKKRVYQEAKIIGFMSKINQKMTKPQVIICENMFVNCLNQYLNTEYEAKKNGHTDDIIKAFLFYYQQIQAKTRVKQLTVIHNCNLFYQINFLSNNLGIFISHVQQSINSLYENEKNRFLSLIKIQIKSISPEKKPEQQQQKFDRTGGIINNNRKKKQLQLYCYSLSKLLNLEHLFLDYFYFNTIDIEKRKKSLLKNFIKRNLYIRKIRENYARQYKQFKDRECVRNQLEIIGNL